MNCYVLLSLGSLMLSVALPVLAADRMAPGQYEIVTIADGKTQTDSVCATPEMANIANGDAKVGREDKQKTLDRLGKGHCTIKAYDITGNTVSSTILCGKSAITTSTTYHGDTSESEVTTTDSGKTMSVRVKAKRVGACK